MSAAQPCFPGMEVYLKPEWQPIPWKLERVKNYFRGYAAHDRDIRGRRQYQADKCRMPLSTFARYLRYLIQTGWMETVRRLPRLAIRVVTEIRKVFSSPPFASSNETSRETSPPIYQVSSEENPGGRKETPELSVTRPLPVGYDELFQRYVGVFISAGKNLNRVDIARAHATWSGMELADRIAAVEDAIKVCKGTRYQRFMPFPVNHLASQGWTRVAAERTLVFEDPKMEERREEMRAMERKMGFI